MSVDLRGDTSRQGVPLLFSLQPRYVLSESLLPYLDQILISKNVPRLASNSRAKKTDFQNYLVVGQGSSFFGPIISSAIIDAAPSHNNSLPFCFLAALSAACLIVILFFVDLKKSRMEQEEFLNDERRARLDLEMKLRARDP